MTASTPLRVSLVFLLLTPWAEAAWSQSCLGVDAEFSWLDTSTVQEEGCGSWAPALEADLVVAEWPTMEATISGLSNSEWVNVVIQIATPVGCRTWVHPEADEASSWLTSCNECLVEVYSVSMSSDSSGVLFMDTWDPDLINASGLWQAKWGALAGEVGLNQLQINVDGAACGGCMYPSACNYNAEAFLDNGSCDFDSCAGCTDSEACNYDSTATVDDGSCDAPPCGPPIDPPGLALVPVNNPFYELSYVADDRTPFLTSYSGWFDDDDIGVGVFNPTDALVMLELSVAGPGQEFSYDLGPVQPMASPSWPNLELPNGMSTHDVISVELRTAMGDELLDRIGDGNEPLSELALNNIPRAAGQHNLLREGWVLRGDVDFVAATWRVVEENEELDFSSLWTLTETVEVVYYSESGECLDSNNDGVCDALELPVSCDNVNASNYSPSALVVLCEEAETLEFWESTCCNDEIEAGGLIGMPPPGSSSGQPPSNATMCGSSASKIAFCNVGQRAFVLDDENQRVRILDYGDLNEPSPLVNGVPMNIDPLYGSLVPSGVDIFNVALPDSIICCSTMVAVAWVDTAVLDRPGFVGLYDTDGQMLSAEWGWLEAGWGTQDVTFSPDGKWLVAANGGAEYPGGGNPLGSLTCWDVSAFTQTPGQVAIEAFPSYEVSLESLSGVEGLEARLTSNGQQVSLGHLLEPSSVHVAPNNETCWVNCGINNAVLEVDLSALDLGENAVLGAYGWGTRNMSSGEGWDGKNDGVSALEASSFPCVGWRQPGDMHLVEAEGTTWIITANEGQPRRLANGSLLIEELTLSGAGSEYNGLQIDPEHGYGESGSLSDTVYVYGSRNFSIWAVPPAGGAPQLAYDSGSDLESVLSRLLPNHANSLKTANGTADQASSIRGPEPSSVTMGLIQGKPHLFVALEQMGGAMVYVLENFGLPGMRASFQGYASNRKFGDLTSDPCSIGDLGAEDVLFLAQAITSATSVSGISEGFDAILVANDQTGTLSTFSLASTLSISGCTYSTASNYLVTATVDDGTCVWEDGCFGDLNGSGVVDTGDLLDLLTVFNSSCD